MMMIYNNNQNGKMRKFLSFIALAGCFLLFCACSSDDDDPNQETATKIIQDIASSPFGSEDAFFYLLK